MATNNSVTGSYCLSKKVTRIASHHLYYSMCSKCPPPARTQVRRRCATLQQLIQSMWLTAAHSLLTRRFSASTSEIFIRQTCSWLMLKK